MRSKSNVSSLLNGPKKKKKQPITRSLVWRSECALFNQPQDKVLISDLPPERYVIRSLPRKEIRIIAGTVRLGGARPELFSSTLVCVHTACAEPELPAAPPDGPVDPSASLGAVMWKRGTLPRNSPRAGDDGKQDSRDRREMQWFWWGIKIRNIA
jgi:hypothetical protein